jgi:putative effector of murein hydrolase LrgA (UPF0299 family)
LSPKPFRRQGATPNCGGVHRSDGVSRHEIVCFNQRPGSASGIGGARIFAEWGSDACDRVRRLTETTMPTAMLILIGCQLFGESLRAAFSLPIPGPVVGMFLLAAILVLRGQNAGDASTPSSLDKTAGTLISHMGLLFVPAGVGIIAETHLLRQEWLPILAAVIGSTVLGVAVTGFVMHRVSLPARREAMSNTPLLGHPEGRP